MPPQLKLNLATGRMQRLTSHIFIFHENAYNKEAVVEIIPFGSLEVREDNG